MWEARATYQRVVSTVSWSVGIGREPNSSTLASDSGTVVMAVAVSYVNVARGSRVLGEEVDQTAWEMV